MASSNRLTLMQTRTPIQELALIQTGFQYADIGQVAIQLRVVEPVSDDELIGDLESDELGMDFDLAALGLVQQDAGRKRPGAALPQTFQQVVERAATVDDIFDHE